MRSLNDYKTHFLIKIYSLSLSLSSSVPFPSPTEQNRPNNQKVGDKWLLTRSLNVTWFQVWLSRKKFGISSLVSGVKIWHREQQSPPIITLRPEMVVSSYIRIINEELGQLVAPNKIPLEQCKKLSKPWTNWPGRLPSYARGAQSFSVVSFFFQAIRSRSSISCPFLE